MTDYAARHVQDKKARARRLRNEREAADRARAKELLLAEVERLIMRDKRALKDGVPIDDGARETIERRLDVLRSIARDCRQQREGQPR